MTLLLSTFEMWVVSHGLPFCSILSLADKHPLLPYSHAHCFTYPSYLCRWYLDEVFWSWGSSQSVYSFKLMPPGYTYFNIWISYIKPNSCFLASSHLKVKKKKANMFFLSFLSWLIIFAIPVIHFEITFDFSLPGFVLDPVNLNSALFLASFFLSCCHHYNSFPYLSEYTLMIGKN